MNFPLKIKATKYICDINPTDLKQLYQIFFIKIN